MIVGDLGLIILLVILFVASYKDYRFIKRINQCTNVIEKNKKG